MMPSARTDARARLLITIKNYFNNSMIYRQCGSDSLSASVCCYIPEIQVELRPMSLVPFSVPLATFLLGSTMTEVRKKVLVAEAKKASQERRFSNMLWLHHV